MSITKRIVDLARSNLNDLLERAAEQVDPRRKLSNLSDEELEAELARRRSARESDASVEAARAKIDAPPQPAAAAPKPAAPPPLSDREAREKAAREREARVKAERDKREKEAQARAQQQRASAPPPRSSASSAPPPKRPPRGADPQIAGYYARLELPYGASYEEVKAAYRRLMRKYHPDLHAQSPERLKAATEVSTALTQAYNELEKVLKR